MKAYLMWLTVINFLQKFMSNKNNKHFCGEVKISRAISGMNELLFNY